MSDSNSIFSQATTVKAEEVKQGEPLEYIYYEKTDKPAKTTDEKPKSKIGSFFSQFQSPAVKKTRDLRDKSKEEERRTGTKKYQSTNPSGSGIWAWT
jgi:hypothetical protein